MLLQSNRSLRPAPKIITPLPNPSPPSSPTTTRNRTNSIPGSPSLSVLPQLLLSSTLPGGPTITGLSAIPPASPTPPSTHSTGSLLSIKDPLSVPILSVNFRRFVSCVGPVFWLQDRIEEIVTWKKGWKVTCSWLSAYGFFCYFPQLLLCLPHIAIIAIILTTYPAGDQPPPTEGSIPWQANIQGIQNLMGIFSDLVDFTTSTHPSLDNSLSTSTSTSSSISDSSTTSTSDTSPRSSTSQKRKKPPSSAYTPHILTLLVVTLAPLAYIVSLPMFPLRLVFFLAGAAPIIGLHPWVMNIFLPAAVLVGERTWNSPVPESVVRAVRRAKKCASRENGEELLVVGKSINASVKTILQRVVDDDRLTDVCWQSEMREVELWENERYVGPPSESITISSTLERRSSFASLTSSIGSSPQRTRIIARVRGSWSKANLKPSERGPWTRRRDGWNGSSGGDSLEEEGQVNSTLTFPLAPGWAFVPTEDWRKDVVAEWALNDCGEGDEDGWVYTNDAWQDSQCSPVRRVSEDITTGDAGGGPYVTRRRRWVRRIWFDPVSARVES
ncbi:hypothetical protein F5887DRAFT_976939 [Amanita rubescens]|nr:hypothetical protein F5887DRAFT_976939 [Amanita rubescens]